MCLTGCFNLLANLMELDLSHNLLSAVPSGKYYLGLETQSPAKLVMLERLVEMTPT